MEANSFARLRDYVTSPISNKLETLPFGASKYSRYGIGLVVDEDCMATEAKDVYKYLILREDGHLYSRWNDKGSLIF
jgi:hypothetical protein